MNYQFEYYDRLKKEWCLSINLGHDSKTFRLLADLPFGQVADLKHWSFRRMPTDPLLRAVILAQLEAAK